VSNFHFHNVDTQNFRQQQKNLGLRLLHGVRM